MRVPALLPALAAAASLTLASVPLQAGGAGGSSSAGEGRDGCYFGVCPEDDSPARSQDFDQPINDGGQDRWARGVGEQPVYQQPQQPQPQMEISNICTTPAGSCFMAQFGPVWSSCWCPSIFGPVNGMVAPP